MLIKHNFNQWQEILTSASKQILASEKWRIEQKSTQRKTHSIFTHTQKTRTANNMSNNRGKKAENNILHVNCMKQTVQLWFICAQNTQFGPFEKKKMRNMYSDRRKNTDMSKLSKWIFLVDRLFWCRFTAEHANGIVAEAIKANQKWIYIQIILMSCGLNSFQLNTLIQNMHTQPHIS